MAIRVRHFVATGMLLFSAACQHAPTRSSPVRLPTAPGRTESSEPLVYWTEQRTTPEPMAIHVLRLDLRDKNYQVDAVIAADPDGDGPAEATLTDPLQLARQSQAMAAVNANAFAGLPDAQGRRDSNWREKLAIDIAGIAVHDGVARSKGGDGSAVDVIFGVDRSGKPYIGPAAGGAALDDAVNAWSFKVLEAGKRVPQPGGPRHPRTAVGVDASGRWLYLVVVDGRQPNHSVGMTARELSDLMVNLGAEHAVNLDGGGSSIMLVGSGDGAFQIVNRPSGGQPRPVPVLLTVRKRAGRL